MPMRAILIRLTVYPLWEWSASFLRHGLKGESSESVSTPTPVNAMSHCSCLSLLLPWFSHYDGLGFQTVGCNKPIFLWSCFCQSNSQPHRRSLHSKFSGHNIVTQSQLCSVPSESITAYVWFGTLSCHSLQQWMPHWEMWAINKTVLQRT